MRTWNDVVVRDMCQHIAYQSQSQFQSIQIQNSSIRNKPNATPACTFTYLHSIKVFSHLYLTTKSRSVATKGQQTTNKRMSLALMYARDWRNVSYRYQIMPFSSVCKLFEYQDTYVSVNSKAKSNMSSSSSVLGVNRLYTSGSKIK